MLKLEYNANVGRVMRLDVMQRVEHLGEVFAGEGPLSQSLLRPLVDSYDDDALIWGRQLWGAIAETSV